MYVFIQPLHCEHNVTQGQLLNKVKLVLNSDFSFFKTRCHPKAKEHSLSYYILIHGCRRDEYIPFPRVSAQSKRGARGVMVIVVGNGHGDTSSNPGRD